MKHTKQIKIKSTCTGCMACKSSCPRSAIETIQNFEGFYYPFIDTSKCINCGICKSVCPLINKGTNTINSFSPTIYAVINLDNIIRLKSSSGGAFHAIASKAIEAGGYVYGVAMSDDGTKAKHIRAESNEQLDTILGSKYLQSDLNDVFVNIKNDLNEGKEVVFSGTPCQIAGLKLFLRKDYSNLLTIDFVCHGVSSPGVWKDYIKEIERNNQKRTRAVSFRDKTCGWKNYSLKISFKDNSSVFNSVINDPYLQAFVRNMTVRISCLCCKYRKFRRNSDITLADCWGADDYLKDNNDDKGISAVIINTKKGEKAFQDLKNVKKMNIAFSDFMKYNPSLTKPIKSYYNRDLFFKEYSQKQQNVIELLQYYNKRKNFRGWIHCIINKLKSLWGA